MIAVDNVQIVQKIYHEFGQGNIAGILSYFDKEVVWERPGYPEIPFSGNFIGHEGMIKFLTLVAKSITIKSFSIKQMISNDDTVVVTGEDSAEVIATGKTYTTHWVQVFTLKEGKVVSGRAYIDTLQMAKAFQP